MSEYNIKWLCGLHALILLLSGLDYGSSAGGHSLMCLNCANVKHPKECNVISKCGPNAMCATTVHRHGHHHDDIAVNLHCRDEYVCPGHVDYTIQLVGTLLGKKRAPGDDHAHVHHHVPDRQGLVCDQCCNNESKCNAHLCGKTLSFCRGPFYQQTYEKRDPGILDPTTTAAPTTVPTTTTVATTAVPTTTTTVQAPSPAPVYDADCRDREEDGVACPMLDLFYLCSDPSTLSYIIAHEKCKRHCGFCTPDPNALVMPAATPPPRDVCANYEQDGIHCASMDLFYFCTEPSSIAYVFAHQKCPEHCGFCSNAAPTTPPTAAPTEPPTAAPTAQPTAQPTAAPTTQPTTAAPPATPSTAAPTAPPTTAAPTAAPTAPPTAAPTTAAPTAAPTTAAPTTAPSTTQGAPDTTPSLPLVTQTVPTQAPAAATSEVTQLPMYSATPATACRDVEEGGFSCTFMDTINICTAPALQTTARDKCSKHCGFCT